MRKRRQVGSTDVYMPLRLRHIQGPQIEGYANRSFIKKAMRPTGLWQHLRQRLWRDYIDEPDLAELLEKALLNQ